MRHNYFGKKLSRTKNERRRLLQALVRELIAHGRVKTTLAKAKAVQPLIEKIVTRSKAGTSASLTSIKKTLADWSTTKLLLTDATSRFASRTSGYTRIVKLGMRKGDGAEEVILEFVDARVAVEPVVKKKKGAAPTKDVKEIKAGKEVPVKKQKPKRVSRKKTT